MVWDSHLLKNFPQFVVIHTFRSSDIVNIAEVHVVSLELSCLISDPKDVDNLTFFSPVAPAEFSQICWHIECRILTASRF